MRFDLTITVPGGEDDAHRVISELVEGGLVAPGRAVYSSREGSLRIRWEGVDTEDADTPTLACALAGLVAVRDGDDDAARVPEIHLDLDASRPLRQADFDPSEDL